MHSLLCFVKRLYQKEKKNIKLKSMKDWIKKTLNLMKDIPLQMREKTYLEAYVDFDWTMTCTWTCPLIRLSFLVLKIWFIVNLSMCPLCRGVEKWSSLQISFMMFSPFILRCLMMPMKVFTDKTLSFILLTYGTPQGFSLISFFLMLPLMINIIFRFDQKVDCRINKITIWHCSI